MPKEEETSEYKIEIRKVDERVGILPVVCVDECAEEDVDDRDEGLRADHAFPEVHWPTHFRQESHEEECA